MFRRAFYKIGGKKMDVLQDGNLSCAVYVSSILKLFDLIPETHTTVKWTVEDMKKAGWKKIATPKTGAVIVWGPKTFKKSGEAHKHIGFYMGNQRAISNDWKKQSPAQHHWTYGTTRDGSPKRVVEAIYWHKKLNR